MVEIARYISDSLGMTIDQWEYLCKASPSNWDAI